MVEELIKCVNILDISMCFDSNFKKYSLLQTTKDAWSEITRVETQRKEAGKASDGIG